MSGYTMPAVLAVVMAAARYARARRALETAAARRHATGAEFAELVKAEQALLAAVDRLGAVDDPLGAEQTFGTGERIG